jgi:uncharacterized RDD family membrane protein YckC
MHCTRCGAWMEADSAFCSSCGAPASTAPGPAGAAPAPMAAAAPAAYAGFWLRFVALIIDGAILGAVFLFALVPLVPSVFRRTLPPFASPLSVPVAFGVVLWSNLFSVLGVWLYYALFESSAWQATPGKRVLGLYVTDLAGRQISFGRATVRYFGKILSSLIFCIGYVMAGFTAKKQALHDIIAECLVLRRR